MLLPFTTALGLLSLTHHASTSPIANKTLGSVSLKAIRMSDQITTVNLYPDLEPEREPDLDQFPIASVHLIDSDYCRIVRHMRELCDIAINFQVYRFPDYFYNPTHTIAGRGHGDENGIRKPCWKADNPYGIGCGILVDGPESCQRSGKQLWRDYQHMRLSAYNLCAFKTWGPKDKCSTRVDLVTNCAFGGESPRPGQEPAPGADGIGGGSGGREEDH